MNPIYKNIFICLVFCYSCSPQPDTSTLLDKLHPCRPEGIRETVLCGNYTVYETRQSKSGRTIDLNII